jgi:hypothetical protein
VEKVHRYTDFPGDSKPSADLDELLTEMTREAEELVRSATIFSAFEAADVPKDTFLHTLLCSSATGSESEKSVPDGKDVSAKDEGNDPTVDDSMTRVVLSICTIGPELEARVSEYSGGSELARALVLDAAGSSLAEAVCDYANERICEMTALRPLYAAPRISPGYGRWSVEEQDMIFGLLPADSIGVTLTKSYMMIPRKSVSFAVKFTEKKPDDQALSPCTRCRRKECEFRR